ncbi:hypothetical protein [Holdemania massiliensis]|uniref:hypothetical protein n=1 Tax=Holdemania massiliensis TaxID=1468449 RepID=UPI001F0544A2|nr:hypothetical protein [Holdemania massiliensis]MCH1940653.1 hypothetical protein [Holdemania massiliensis]
MLDKIKNSLYRFMAGRYGTDSLNNFLLFAAIAVMLINMLTLRSPFVNLLADALIFLSLFRTLSRNTWKRQKENLKYMELTRPVRSRFSLIKKNASDKEHKYFSCPHCHQTVRVPRGHGKIEITCPRCKSTFERKS